MMQSECNISEYNFMDKISVTPILQIQNVTIQKGEDEEIDQKSNSREELVLSFHSVRMSEVSQSFFQEKVQKDEVGSKVAKKVSTRSNNRFGRQGDLEFKHITEYLNNMENQSESCVSFSSEISSIRMSSHRQSLNQQ